MKKTSKILVALCMILAIVTMSVISFAAGEGSGEISPGIFSGGNLDSASTEGIVNLGNQIVTVVRTVGVLVAVVILLILGIKYMMGSAEEKADYKKSMIPYIVGAVLIFAASTITGIVYDMARALEGSGT